MSAEAKLDNAKCDGCDDAREVRHALIAQVAKLEAEVRRLNVHVHVQLEHRTIRNPLRFYREVAKARRAEKKEVK